MSKVKMRCTVCGKWFQSANAKEVTCPDCVQKARKEKLAAKNTPPSTQKSADAANIKATGGSRPPVLPPKPKQQVRSGTNQWLDKLEDVKVGQPEQPPVRSKSSPPPVQRDQQAGSGSQDSTKPYTHQRDEYERGSGSHRPSGGLASGFGQRPRVPQEGNVARGPYSGHKPAHAGERGGRPQGGPRGKNKPRTPKEPAPPKPPREKIPPPPPFVPTPEQIKQVEERYLELAQPIEFDGIRTQIANELQIPKKAVKQIVKNLRNQSHIPSWWELQTYKGSTEELEKIKAVYEPYLPLPPIGVHKTIAQELSIKPGIAYQAIKSIRQELGLPQYNDPVLHGLEPSQPSEQADSEPTPVSAQPEGEIAQPAPVSADQVPSSSES